MVKFIKSFKNHSYFNYFILADIEWNFPYLFKEEFFEIDERIIKKKTKSNLMHREINAKIFILNACPSSKNSSFRIDVELFLAYAIKSFWNGLMDYF